MKKLIVLSAFLLFIGATQVWAADGQFSVFAGYLNPGDVNLDNVRESLRFRGTSVYGVRAEVDFLKVLGMEHNFSFSPRLFNSSLFPDEASDLRGFLYSGNLVVNVPLSRFVPYVTGGVGFIKPWGTGLKPFDATFAGNYGGGVKLNRLIGPVGLRFDVRGWRTADIADRGSINIFEATGALTFSW